ncbi:MAG: porin family protein [Rhodobacteraceae bacterium]|nr:porin family protein [Paracoccaceae bacterium]
MKHIAIAALLISTAMVNGATAADMSYQENSGSVGANPFEGFYVGLQAGYGQLNGKDSLGSSKILKSGIGGVYSGYDFAVGQMVFGLAAEANLASYSTSSATGLSTSKSNWNGSTTARIGYAIERFLPYLSAGVGFGEYSVKRRSNGETSANTHVGLVAGAGIEGMLSDKLSLRVDYKHFEMGKKTYQFTGFNPFTVEGRQDTLTLGAAYRF